jgi:ABC-2 type transport system ATP-binding protein
VQALIDVSMELSTGVTALLGRNGAGKSTLCRIIAGIEPPDSGGLTRAGDSVGGGRRAVRSHHRETGWLPQSFNTPGSMTVRQYVGYAAWLKEVPRRGVVEAVESALSRADLSELEHRRLRQLSGGMLKRVGIAQAIVHDPSFLVLDEPTAGLDPEQRRHFHDIVRSLARDRIVLLSTHLLEDVEALAQRVVVLDEGAIKFDDNRAALADAADGLGPSADATDSLRDGFLAVVRRS